MPVDMSDAPPIPPVRIESPRGGDQVVISSKPDRPTVRLRLDFGGRAPEAIAALGLSYEVTIAYEREGCPFEPPRAFRTSARGPIDGQETPVTLPEIVGGRLSVAVTGSDSSIRIAPVTGIAVVATNPTRAEVRAAFPNRTFARMSFLESGLRQFQAAPGKTSPCPLWSRDSHGGVGIAQLTTPAPTAEQVWDWRANVEGGWRLFRRKLSTAALYPAQIEQSARFAGMVAAFNARREANGLPALRISVPAFASGDLDEDLGALQLDGLRGYNGYTGRDRFGMVLHEHRIKVDPQTGDLVVRVDEASRTGSIVWERVPPADRPRHGDPNYIANVARQTP